MQLSRKRRRELKKLRKEAEQLLDQQRVVLGHAGEVIGKASHQARKLGDEVVMPRVDEAVSRVRPTVERNLRSARRAVDRVKVATVPIVAAALASTIKSLDRIDQRQAADQVRHFGEGIGVLEKPKRRTAGGIIAIGLGVAAAAAVGYALWQAFRTDDDDMWMSADDG